MRQSGWPLLFVALCACDAQTMSVTPTVDSFVMMTTGCMLETDCDSPTPYCEPTTKTCVECRFSSHCAGTNSVCEGQACRLARSCQELKAELPGLTSGVYRIDLDGATGALEPMDVFCEMTIDGGGWTLIQRTLWAWSASQPLHTAFSAWHDTTFGTPAAGVAYRLAGMHWPTVATKGELMISHRVRTTAGTACNPLWYIGRGGMLTVNKTAKTVSLTNLVQPVAMVAGTMNGAAINAVLSTTDSGDAMASSTCVNMSSAVPWFYTVCCSTCATYKGGYWNDEPHPMTTTTITADFFGRTEADVCASQTVRLADNASTFRGIDTMEMYLR